MIHIKKTLLGLMLSVMPLTGSTLIMANDVLPSVLVQFQLQAGETSGQALTKFLDKILPATRAYQGNQKAQYFVSQQDPSIILLLEEWTSKQAFEAYREWRVAAGDFETLQSLLKTKPVISYFKSSTRLAVSSLESETRAGKEFTLHSAVAKASRAWRDAFNAGDAAAAAALYEKDAVMVAKPFGTFKGREAIQAFWTDIIDKGFAEVVYYNTQTTVVDQSLSAARVSADWTMNHAKGVITNELWVLQPDGTALLREDHFEITQ